MSFTYNFATDPQISGIRLLIADTNPAQPIFQDEEITGASAIVQSQFQSGMFFNTNSGATGGGTLGAYLPSTPVPYFRIAATLLNSMASNKAYLSSVSQLLDVKLDPAKASSALRQMAKDYLDMDDNSGAFMIIEQVNDSWSFRDRFWKAWQRQSAGTGS